MKRILFLLAFFPFLAFGQDTHLYDSAYGVKKTVNSNGVTKFGVDTSVIKSGTTGPQVLGLIFGSNNMSSATFPTATATVTYSGGKPTISGGTALTDSTHYISRTDTGVLERQVWGVRFICPSITSTTRGIAIGTRSTNQNYMASMWGTAEFSTGNAGKVSFWSRGSNITGQSSTACTANALDTMTLIFEKTLDSAYVRLINNMTATPSMSQVLYGFSIGSGGASLQNTGVTTVWTFGDAIKIDSVWTSSNEIKGANILFIGTSKEEGYNQGNFSQMWVHQAGMAYGTFVNHSGTGDRTTDAVSSIPQILSLAPKCIALPIGCNDVNSESIFETNYMTLYNTFTAAGIPVIPMTPAFETTRDMSVEYAYIKRTFPNAVDVYKATKAAQAHLTDGIHGDIVWADTMAKTFIMANVVPFGAVNSWMPNAFVNAPLNYVPKIVNAWNIMGPSSITDDGTNVTIANALTTTGKTTIGGGSGKFPRLEFVDQSNQSQLFDFLASSNTFQFYSRIGNRALMVYDTANHFLIPNPNYGGGTPSLSIGGSSIVSSGVALSVFALSGSVAIESHGQIRVENPNGAIYWYAQGDNSQRAAIYAPNNNSLNFQFSGTDGLFLGANGLAVGGSGPQSNRLYDGGDLLVVDSVELDKVPNGVSGTDSVALLHRKSNGKFIVYKGAPLSSSGTGSSGVFVPNVSNLSNITSVTADSTFWIQIGPIVFVRGSITGTITTGSTAVTMDIDIPVASNLATAHSSWGDGEIGGTSSLNGISILTNVATNKPRILFNPNTSGSVTLYYSYAYIVR